MLMLPVVNTVVGQPSLFRDTVVLQAPHLDSIQGFVPPDSLQDPARLNQQSTDWHWRLSSTSRHVAPLPSDFSFDLRC